MVVVTRDSDHEDRDQAFQRLIPLLIDLDGWQGMKPDGMSMEMPGGGMTTATRVYQKGPAKANAAVMTGQAASGALAPIQSGMKVSTSEGHMVTDTMQGMKVMKSYATVQKSGALLVALDIYSPPGLDLSSREHCNARRVGGMEAPRRS